MGLHERKPEWLKVRMPGGERHAELTQTFRRLKLHTVCEEARCPNIGECWREGTATIMILGDVCTRGCRFCAVTSGQPGGTVDESEPAHVAGALAQMDLAYVVLTMVDRDDLPDGGAAHVARTVSAIHARSPELLVETLVGDFAGNADLIATVVQRGRPDVYAHNVEVVPSLQRKMRDARCSWERSLQTLVAAREAGANVTKSSLMVGCGETADEVESAMRELRTANIDVLTIGQYLRPTPKHAPVMRYVEPAEFDHFKQVGEALGFQYIASGPLVRSSYRAAEAFLKGKLRGERVRYSDRYGKRRLEVVT
ncbi:MAG TPA: lipoyl synthase [Polyangiales bacterium]|nr:lipoyl synthase [Polyangiales bacterium]